MSRCKETREINDGLFSRCVRRKGHSLAHAFPSLWLYRNDRGYWHTLAEPSVVMTVREVERDGMGYDFVYPLLKD